MIKSPTYTIVREYEGRLPLYHLDVYRIGNDPDSIDLDDFLFGDGATIIEWGELIEPSLSDAYLKIFIRKLEDGRELALKLMERVQKLLLTSLEQVEKRMTKEKEVTVEIRQADSADAALVVDFLNQVGKESDYMTLDEAGIGMSPADMEQFLIGARNGGKSVCLLLFLDQELAALLNITAASSTVHSAYW